jgi:hypothetical protein
MVYVCVRGGGFELSELGLNCRGKKEVYYNQEEIDIEEQNEDNTTKTNGVQKIFVSSTRIDFTKIKVIISSIMIRLKVN